MRGLKIGDWRTKIDAIDTTLLHLLNVRAAFALEVGKLKGQAGMLLRVPARERDPLAHEKAKSGPAGRRGGGKNLPVDSERIDSHSRKLRLRNGGRF